MSPRTTLRVNRPDIFFLCKFDQKKLEFLEDMLFMKTRNMKIFFDATSPMGVELIHASRRTYRHEANKRFFFA